MMIADTGAKNGRSCPSTSVAMIHAAAAATDTCRTARHETLSRSRRVRIETRDRSAASSISGAARSLSWRGSVARRRGMVRDRGMNPNRRPGPTKVLRRIAVGAAGRRS
jgi:hypothetical protein